MNTQPKMSIEEENTQRVIGRAVRLGYIIVSIRINGDDARVQVIPSPRAPYTPELTCDAVTGEWVIQTTAYGALNAGEIQKIAGGYQRAVAMVSEPRYLDANNVIDYHVTD